MHSLFELLCTIVLFVLFFFITTPRAIKNVPFCFWLYCRVNCRVFLSVSTGTKSIKSTKKRRSYYQKQSGTFLWLTVYHGLTMREPWPAHQSCRSEPGVLRLQKTGLTRMLHPWSIFVMIVMRLSITYISYNGQTLSYTSSMTTTRQESFYPRKQAAINTIQFETIQ